MVLGLGAWLLSPGDHEQASVCNFIPETAPLGRGSSPPVGEIQAGLLGVVLLELGVWDSFF